MQPLLGRAGFGPFRAAGVALAAVGLTAGLLTSMPAVAAKPQSRLVAAGANADRAAVEAARRFLCPHGGAPRRGGRCRGGGGGAVASAIGGGDVSVRGWDAGLPAVTRRQAPCPSGTVQARVLFWESAVRCVPR